MKQQEFLEKCVALLEGPIDKHWAIDGDYSIDSKWGKLYTEPVPRLGTGEIQCATYEGRGVEITVAPFIDRELNARNFQHCYEALVHVIGMTKVRHTKDIMQIEQYITQLEEIRKVPVRWAREYSTSYPRAKAILKLPASSITGPKALGWESEMVLLEVSGDCIQYAPASNTLEKAGLGARTGGPVKVHRVQDLLLEPLPVAEKISRRRYSMKGNMFVTPNLRYVVEPNEDNYYQGYFYRDAE